MFDLWKVVLWLIPCFGFSLGQHYTDCRSLSNFECEVNFWDCEFGFSTCEANELPPLQLVFLIDTTLEDQTYYSTLFDVYNFLNEILNTARFRYVCGIVLFFFVMFATNFYDVYI